MLTDREDSVIKLNHVSKFYKLYDKPVDRLKESLNLLGKKYHKEFHAIDDVSFNINRNETVGIVGKNGSGKSTLLKMITGILNPTSGSVQVEGKISALLELGAGFNPEYTGIENIYLNGTIMGLSKDDMDQKLDDILSFADIGDFIYQPVKLYSSGMFVRLAFAVAINVDPDILIVDEALSVGDMRFQQKCFRKIEEFKKTKTILVVSHDMGTITTYCDRAIWINEGELMANGDPLEIAKQYQAFMIGSSLNRFADLAKTDVATNEQSIHIDPLDANLDVLGDNKATILGINMFDVVSEQKVSILSPKQPVRVMIKVRANEHLENIIVGLTLKDRLGTILAQTNTYALGVQLSHLEPGETTIYSFEFDFPMLNQGQYTLSPAIATGTQEEHIQHSWVHDALIFHVLANGKFSLVEGFLILDGIEFSQYS
ncbi:ABC transporter ATP-binding protein [Paenibacillus campi]|uniref:ABC transporter ATP-binding protein n=1 Tax=Paenibacillus campi TaxID=3106031 RepID=UPI002B0011BA|nr:ABC transporter ATP-binding protein [Paenibacillus sp. SGZ-1014]